jgi:hypothetical protein
MTLKDGSTTDPDEIFQYVLGEQLHNWAQVIFNEAYDQGGDTSSWNNYLMHDGTSGGVPNWSNSFWFSTLQSVSNMDMGATQFWWDTTTKTCQVPLSDLSGNIGTGTAGEACSLSGIASSMKFDTGEAGYLPKSVDTGVAGLPGMQGNGDIFIQFYTNGTVGTTDPVTVTSTTDVCDATWHHIMLVGDGTNVNLYIDNTSEDSAAYSAGVPFSIGCWINTSANPNAISKFFWLQYDDEYTIRFGSAGAPLTTTYITDIRMLQGAGWSSANRTAIYASGNGTSATVNETHHYKINITNEGTSADWYTNEIDFVSAEKDLGAGNQCDNALLILNETIDSANSTTYYMSSHATSGTPSWEAVSLKQIHRFASGGRYLQVKVVEDRSGDDTATDTITEFAVMYNIGAGTG